MCMNFIMMVVHASSGNCTLVGRTRIYPRGYPWNLQKSLIEPCMQFLDVFLFLWANGRGHLSVGAKQPLERLMRTALALDPT